MNKGSPVVAVPPGLDPCTALRFRVVTDPAARRALYESGEVDAALADVAADGTLSFAGPREIVDDLARLPWRRQEVAPAPRVARVALPADALGRAQGCLLGQLAGDALGAQVEFRNAEEIAAEYPDGVRELRDGGTWNTLAGQPTDDSELALALARTLVARGTYDAAATRGAYVEWFHSNPFDIGGTTASGLAGHPDDRSQANGSLMRISPIGVAAAGHPERAAAWARADSALTHPNPICADACAAFAAAIAAGIRGDAAPYDVACATAVEPAVRETLARARDAPPADFLRHAGWVLTALQNAFFQLLHAGSLEAALVATVGRGGDTDTNGAICGALLGAVHGRTAVPRRWANAILTCRARAEAGARRPRPPTYWPVDALELAEALLVIAG